MLKKKKLLMECNINPKDPFFILFVNLFYFLTNKNKVLEFLKAGQLNDLLDNK